MKAVGTQPIRPMTTTTPYRPRTALATHTVDNQPPPLVDYNAYTSDAALIDAVRREGGGWGGPRLEAYGAIAGGELIEIGATANANPPALRAFDRYGQRIDEASGTIENVIEYTPAAWVPLDALVRLGAADDRLQQRVLLEYEYDGPRCTAKLAGVSLRARRLLGVSLESASPLTLKGPLTLPFGNFEVLYNDGSLRAVRTQQGYWGVNRRCDEDDGWGA